MDERQQAIIKAYGRKRSIYRIGSALWLIGTAIIAASWFQAVSHSVGWCGFLISLTGALMQFFSTKRW